MRCIAVGAAVAVAAAVAMGERLDLGHQKDTCGQRLRPSSLSAAAAAVRIGGYRGDQARPPPPPPVPPPVLPPVLWPVLWPVLPHPGARSTTRCRPLAVAAAAALVAAPVSTLWERQPPNASAVRPVSSRPSASDPSASSLTWPRPDTKPVALPTRTSEKSATARGAAALQGCTCSDSVAAVRVCSPVQACGVHCCCHREDSLTEQSS